MAKQVFVGDTVIATLQLRTRDLINPELENEFPLPPTHLIEAKLPGNAGSIVASTANPGEVAIIDANKSTITVVWDSTKTQDLKVGVGAIDVVVKDTSVSPNIVTTFEKIKAVTIKSAENA